MKITTQAPAKPLSRVATYAQDPMVGPVIEDTIELDKIGRRVDGPRVSVWDQEVMRASADGQGNYLYGPDNRKFDQVQAFVTSQKTLDLFENYANRKLPWAFESEALGVGPHAGEGVNAYYQRFSESLSFYYFDSKALGRRVQTSQSADVVSHETGHAILDGLKPEFGHTFDRETKAFHEAFGDCAAMLLTLSRPANRQAVLSETGGDLRRENCLSRMGEEFGYAVRRMNKDPEDDRDYLRTHLNTFAYVNPDTLPADGPRETLSGEAHSFCQVWTRSFYDCLAGLYEQTGDLGQAGEIGGNLLTLGVHLVSPTRARYSQLAGAMVRADQLLYQGRHEGVLRQAFARAGIEIAQEPVPDFTWTQAPADLASAQPLLDQLGPGGFQAQRILKDGHGYTVVEGVRTQTVRDQEKSSEVAQGMSLSFDPAGKLVHKVVDEASPQSELIGMQDEISASGTGLPPTWRALRDLSDGTTLISRLPVFID
ncbi:MAG: M36 family metallopeptidase [Vulcanimicrobiota bacterium]